MEGSRPALQLSVGFHPELTGVESVRMNAALLGLSAQQTEAAFDTIVEFSGIGQFVQEPLRTYSYAMAMRLAVSIAVHAEPEILIIDEVLLATRRFRRSAWEAPGISANGAKRCYTLPSAPCRVLRAGALAGSRRARYDSNAAEVAAAYEGKTRMDGV